ncbi:MAG: hypothetical protein APR62_01655 [Smithella sp. SDB]|nr:MAG: hypothetical protein APR62_01655 [Smithella sp. SDB]
MRKPKTKPTKLAEERKWYSWLDKEQPDDKKISRGFCARRNILHLLSRRKSVHSRQKSVTDKSHIVPFLLKIYFIISDKRKKLKV